MQSLHAVAVEQWRHQVTACDKGRHLNIHCNNDRAQTFVTSLSPSHYKVACTHTIGEVNNFNQHR